MACVSRTSWVSRYQKGKTSLDLDEARRDGVLGCSDDRWTICKQSARRISTPTPHLMLVTTSLCPAELRLLLTACRAAVNGYLLPAGPSAAAAAVAGCDGRTDARQFHRPRYSLHLLTYLSREWYKQLTGSSRCM